jgi:GDP-L-fucose synthase
VGSAIHRRLLALGFTDVVVRTHAELDLTRQAAVEAFFAERMPITHAAFVANDRTAP